MAYRLDLWDLFADPAYWWLAAMLGLWLVFMVMLFVIEPLLHARFERRAREDPATSFRRMGGIHDLLLLLAALTAFGAVAGVHGFFF
jgi:hypothetical protein